jgi:hypothetical protein
MADTTIIIFFVGLTMFSSQIPNDLGQKAILPRVVYVDPTTPINFTHNNNFAHVRAETDQFEQAPPAAARPAAAPPTAGAPPPAPASMRFSVNDAIPFGPQPHVEDHQSVLIFPDSLYDVSSTWPKKELKTDKAYSYIVLDRDLVRFVTELPPGTPPQTLKSNKLILPQLATLCSKMKPLRSDYLPPYQGAAAVFDLAQEGELSSCLSPTKLSQQRLDSKLVLKTVGKRFVVSANTMSTTKELRLKLENANGSVNVYVATIPTRFLEGDFSVISSTALNGQPHVRGYYDMARDGASCNQTLQSWYTAYENDPSKDPIPACGYTFTGAGIPVGPVGGGTTTMPVALIAQRTRFQTPRVAIPIPGQIPPEQGPLKTVAMTFECSNSSWP